MKREGEKGATASAITRDLRADRLRVGIPMLAVATIFLFTLLLQTCLDTLVFALAPTWREAAWYPWVLSMAPMYVAAMPFSLLIYRMVPGEPPKKRDVDIPTLLGLLAICFALTYVGNLMGIVINGVIGTVTGHTPENPLSGTATAAPFWSNLLFLGILAPIMEEIFYRKMVLDRIGRYGDLPAILISGTVFGLVHGNFSQFFYAASIGMLLGYVYLKTGKLRYTVALHMGVNLIGGVYSTEMLRRIEAMGEGGEFLLPLLRNLGVIPMMAFYLLFLCSVVVGAPVAIRALWKRVRLCRAENPLRGGEWVRVLLFNPLVWMLAMVIVLLFLTALAA